MDKFAQKRSILNKLKEKTNISGIAAEKFFNPEFQKVMTALRLKDDYIRSIVSGEKIGDGDFGADSSGLKQLLKDCKSNLNRREYMSSISDLGRFHAKLSEIEHHIQQLDGSVNDVHHEFLFKDLDDEKKEHLHRMKQRLASKQTKLVKYAGIMDFFHNIGTQRGRALAAWEKRYPKKTAELKKQTLSMLDKSESFLNTILVTLKEMATDRANRNVDSYMGNVAKISKLISVYDKSFRTYYETNVKDFMKYIEIANTSSVTIPNSDDVKMNEEHSNNAPVSSSQGFEHTPPSSYDKTKSTSTSTSTTPFDLINKSVPLPGSETKIENSGPVTSFMSPPAHKSSVTLRGEESVLPIGPTMPSPEFIQGALRPPKVPSVTNPIAPESKTPESEALTDKMESNLSEKPSDKNERKPTLLGVAPPAQVNPGKSNESVVQQNGNKSDQIAKEYGWASHRAFYDTLEAMGNESPMILKVFISKYAKKIESTDLVTSIKLFQIVKNIKG